MTLRTSLVIDGSAQGAKQAAAETSDAINALRENATRSGKAIEDSFRGVGAGSKPANDNLKSGGEVALQVFEKLLSKVLSNNKALADASGAATTFVSALTGIGKAVGPVGLVLAGLQLVETAAGLLHQAIARGEIETAQRLEEHARLVGIVKDAYSDAEKKAGEFYKQSRNITQLQLEQNRINLAASLLQLTRPTTSKFEKPSSVSDMGDLTPGITTEFRVPAEMNAFREAYEGLHASIARGQPDVIAFREEIAKIGLAATRDGNPALAAQAAEILKSTQSLADLALGIEKTEAMLRLLGGTATDTDRKLLGLSTTTDKAVNEFERATKSLQRQAAAQEAEAQAVGMSVGRQAALRAELLLLEAAKQADITLTQKQRAEVAALAERIGAATQKAAELRLQSDARFGREQLGRDPIEASVAASLRPVFGDDYAREMNGATAAQLRFNEQMRIGKDLVTDTVTGFAQELRAELRAGANAWEAFAKAGLNALQRLSDKLLDMALMNGVTKIFGSFLSSGASSLTDATFGGFSAAGSSAASVKFDGGGYTGDIDRRAVAGVVHGGEFVFDADTTARNRPLFEAIHRGGLRGYDQGGFVGSLPTPVGGAGGPPIVHVYPAAPGESFTAQQNANGSLTLIGTMMDEKLAAFSQHALPSRVAELGLDPRMRS